MHLWPEHAVIYTETVVHTAPEQFASEAPYQLAIVEETNGQRFTVRILPAPSGARSCVGDAVMFFEERGGVAYYRSASDRQVYLPAN